MACKHNACRVALIVAFLVMSGGIYAQSPPAERSLTLTSGATLKVSTDWAVTEVKDGLTLEDPEKQLKIEVVEVDASAGLSASIAAAWSSRKPGFSRQELSSSDSPGREGWDLSRWAEYKTSPEESRAVSAYAYKRDSHAVVLLADASLAAAQRRSAQIALVFGSLRPAGYVRETYLGRTPRPLDAARVEFRHRPVEFLV